jgi:CRISPR/Cas system-associated protein Cas10 (large subunit of type III CRISPR-Cas system)
MFHNPRERCPFNPCLLGHDEAREALKASKAFGRCERPKPSEDVSASQNSRKTNSTRPIRTSRRTQWPKQISLPRQKNPNPPLKTRSKTIENLNESRPAEIGTEKFILTLNPPVNFETLTKQNTQVGEQDEMKRVYQMTDELRKEMEAFKKQVAEKEEAKEKEVRTLQEAVGPYLLGHA